MVDDPILQRLRALLSEFTSVPESELRADSTPENTAGWDSAANLFLFAAIEEEYTVTFGTRDIMRLRSLGDIAAFLTASNARAQPSVPNA